MKTQKKETIESVTGKVTLNKKIEDAKNFAKKVDWSKFRELQQL